MIEPTTMKAYIPVVKEARSIAAALGEGLSDVQVYVVGGLVRDWLYWHFHTDKSMKFQAKDTDLATNLSEEQILRQLQTPAAKARGIRVKEKESVDTFGVVFVSVNGVGPFEVAPFRKDSASSDGRHPDAVERGTILDDAARRDLTINSLYYDPPRQLILDFNEGGAGIEDVKTGRVRTVGDPFQRFDEDKLRILRMVRFFSRYNPGLIIDSLDSQTIMAVEKYKNLMSFKGMSLERIQTEFTLGLKQCLNLPNYLRNYLDLDLFAAVFPDCELDRLWAIEHLDDACSTRVTLAALLHTNGKNVAAILNRLKYPTNVAEPVQFLVDAMTFDPTDVVDLLKARDRRLIKSNKRELTEEESCINGDIWCDTASDIRALARVLSDDRRRVALLEHLAHFNHKPKSGEELMATGLKGPEVGAAQRAEIQTAYNESLPKHLKAEEQAGHE